jgi:hypothetical protein
LARISSKIASKLTSMATALCASRYPGYHLIAKSFREAFAVFLRQSSPRPIGSGFCVKLRTGWPLLRGLAVALTQGRE